MTYIRTLREKAGFLKSDQKDFRKMMSKKLLRKKRERSRREVADVTDLMSR